MSHFVELADLPAWLAAETASRDREIAVLAGHFAIMSAGGRAVDGLDGTATPAAAAPMAEFTRSTWRVACEVAHGAGGNRFGLVVLVDDVQLIRPVLDDRASAERLAAAIAQQYLDAVPNLPEHHAGEMAHHGIDHDRIIRRSDAQALFSERELRRDVVHRLRARLTADMTTPATLSSSDHGSTLSVSLPGHGVYSLVQSGHATCAGGYVELLSTLYERGVRKLIAFVPQRCLGQVALGSMLATRLFPLDGFSVVNVAVGDSGTTSRAVVDRHGTD